MKLTKTQDVASKAVGKNILVSAGAGTGKTRVLVERFLNLVTSGQASVTEILALTFTEKAANEMKSRILERFNDLGLESARRDLESSYISTIHAFAARVLREHPLEAGLDPEFRVIESEEMLFLKEQALDEALDLRCERGTPIFELVKAYGEFRIREGLMKILDASRHEGRYLKEYFAGAAETGAEEALRQCRTALEHLETLGETDLHREFQRFYEREVWDWDTVDEFRDWCRGFSRKRGKKGETYWAQIKELCRSLEALKIEGLTKPWKESFETLAISFEEIYESKKRERGFLDFDDLQIRSVRLFREAGAGRARLRGHYRRRFRQIMVDEFQDTNPIQLELIELLAHENNLFFVGDYKQSIYAFRGAEPALFLQKEESYKNSEKEMWIPLLENFRTGAPVLDFINRFFEGLWREDRIAYDGLLCRAEECGDGGVELMEVKLQEAEPMEHARMREADLIAQRIAQLHEEGTPYGDMAVLFQAMTGIGLYEQAFKKNGIPYYVLSGGGFYHQPEVRDLVSYLSFLENPLADIPLAGSLRSPLFQISDNTLFWLAHHAKTGASREKGSVPPPLYQGVKKAADLPELNEEEKAKIAFFLELAEELLAIKDRLTLTELLDRILSRTSYELTVLADVQGIRRYANLKKLVNLARELERIEPFSIRSFLRTLRRLEVHEVRESEAQIEAEQSGRVVRLLSIHRAKGLEFPVVFVADTGRARQSPEAKTVLTASGFGYGLQVPHGKTLELEEPWSWQRVNEQLNRKDQEEWKRLFYVAVTRAKTRLIFSGVSKERSKEKAHFYEMSSWMEWLQASDLGGVEIRGENWVRPQKRRRALAEKADLKKVFADFQPQDFQKIVPDAARMRTAAEEGEKLFARLQAKEVRKGRVIDLPVSAYASFSKDPVRYWRTYELGYADKISGVDLLDTWGPGEEADGENNAADFGTRMHRVLERLDFNQTDPETLDRLIAHYFSGLSLAQRMEALAIVSRFSASSVFNQLQKARTIHRELPFVLNERHGIIHGVIDVLFQDEKDHWHVLDYKTAVGSEEKVQESGYEMQIQLYAHAVYRILGEAPLSGILYFLKNDWQYRVDLGEPAMRDVGLLVKRLQQGVLDLSPATV